MEQPEFAPAYQISGEEDLSAFAPPPEPQEQEPAAPEAPPPAPEPEDPRVTARAIASVSAKVTMLSERLRAQETATARLQSAVERIESAASEISKRTQPMLETLSAELARQGAMLETLRTETESALDLHDRRVTELDQRMAAVLREMRELVAGKLESHDLAVSDRLERFQQEIGDRLAVFEETVEELVRRFAAEAIPEEMRAKVEDLSSRFVYAETALAATRSSVEFLRSEVGSLTMQIRKLGPAGR